jgi:Protein of unknown function (DUF3467)
VDEKEINFLYANSAALTSSESDIVMIFSQNIPANPLSEKKVHKTDFTILMSPPQAKRFLNGLSQVITNHEKLYGEIKLLSPKPAEPKK